MKMARIILFLLVLMTLVPAASAQTGGEENPSGDATPTAQAVVPSSQSIQLNTPLTVSLDGATPVLLNYKAGTGEVVTISVRSLEPNNAVDPIIAVLDASGSVVAENDDHRTSRTDLAPRDSLIEGLTLTDAGRYTLQLTVFEGAGAVEVLLSNEGGTLNNLSNQGNQGGSDEIIEDTIQDGGMFSYDFSATAGEVLTVTVRATDNVLDPQTSILDSEGERLAYNDDHTSGDSSLGPYDSQIADFEVPATGSYTIQVTPFNAEGGAFELTISRGGGGQPQTDPTPVATGETEVINESIDPNDVYTHAFSARAGDVYTITAQATSDGFDPRISLYFDNSYVIDNDDYGTNDPSLQITDSRLYNVIIQETGEYELDVRGYQDSAGNFTLTLERVATGAPTGIPDEQIELGSVRAGQSYTYSFDAEAGDYVTISARGLSFEFDAYVALLDADGTVLINNDDHGGGSAELAFYDARIPNFFIEASGTYTVEVTGVGGSVGTFGLTIGTLR